MPGPLNALVLGVGGNVSQSIQKALAIATIPTRVVAACISAESAGLYVADRAYISPLARDPAFVPWLFDVCEREAIDVVLSGSEIVLEELAPHAQDLRERTGAVAIVSSPATLARGRDKLETCRWLEACGLPVPGFAHFRDRAAVAALADRHGFPLIAKPRFGKGSEGILVLRDEAELERAVGLEEVALRHVHGAQAPAHELVIQQYLGDEREEYTAGCFCDGDGSVRGTIVLRRSLQAGTTVTAELVNHPAAARTAGAIAGALAPLGPCNIQLRVDEGEPVPFEINPRFSGTTALRARMGFNEVEAALRLFVLGERPFALQAKGGGAIAVRYWNEIYLKPQARDELARAGELAQPRPEQVEDWGLAR